MKTETGKNNYSMVEEEDVGTEQSNVINDEDNNSFNRRNAQKHLGQKNIHGEHERIIDKDVRSGSIGLKMLFPYLGKTC